MCVNNWGCALFNRNQLKILSGKQVGVIWIWMLKKTEFICIVIQFIQVKQSLSRKKIECWLDKVLFESFWKRWQTLKFVKRMGGRTDRQTERCEPRANACSNFKDVCLSVSLVSSATHSPRFTQHIWDPLFHRLNPVKWLINKSICFTFGINQSLVYSFPDVRFVWLPSTSNMVQVIRDLITH